MSEVVSGSAIVGKCEGLRLIINLTCGTDAVSKWEKRRSAALWEPREVNQGLREHFAQSCFFSVTRCDYLIQRKNVDL